MKLNNIRKCNAGRKSTAALTFACLSGLTVLGLTACSDNELDSTNVGQDGTAVRFQVTTADKQAQQAAKANPNFAMTRAGYAEQLQTQGLTPEDLATRKIEIPGNSEYCLIESTVAGIDDDFTNDNAVATRAKITTTATLGKFSAIAYRGSSATGISTTPWFYNAEVNANGTLATTQLWSWSEPYARFYAVYPQVTTSYSKLTLSPSTNTSTPYVNIEVEPGVQDQKDLMTACTGTTPIHYNTLGTAPAVPLQFQHAMTAIRFKIGDRLSGTHKITKIEIVGAKSKGKFTLPSSVQATTGASFNSAWSDVSTPATFTLAGISVNTSGHVNETIVGKDGDSFTFYMIPQTLSSDVKVKVYFDNQASPAIVAPFTGTWKAGTTKTYALSQSANNLKYTFTATPATVATSDDGATTTYQVTSYVNDDSQQRPVKWKVVGYDTDGDGKFLDAKPDWLRSLDGEGGSGTNITETHTATFNANERNLLEERNKAMQDKKVTPNYNLSNSTGASAIQNTANCYVIDAPGTYRIPLVYGNAIKNGSDNTSAYKTTVTGGFVPGFTEELTLDNFVDHNDHKITSPYINEQNAARPATQAEVIWSDVAGVVTNEKVTGSGQSSFLEFTVNKNQLVNGNAVIAVKNASGTVMWSWHLWFTPKSSLDKIAMTSDGQTYNFTSDNLGWKYTSWWGGTKDRTVVVKLEQQAEVGTKKEATVTLTQKKGKDERIGYGNLYQWGRKDPMPGTDDLHPAGYSFNGSGYVTVGKEESEYNKPENKARMEARTIGLSIQKPGEMLPKVGGGKLSWFYKQYINLWSTDNNKFDGSVRDGKKTIYDPSPVGFKVPDAYAFEGFSLTGAEWNNGYTFIANNNKDIYFQAGGTRVGVDMPHLSLTAGSLTGNGTTGYYWQSVPTLKEHGKPGYGLRTSLTNGSINTFFPPANDTANDYGSYANAYGVRPVAE